MHANEEEGEEYFMPYKMNSDGSVSSDPGPNNENFWKQDAARSQRPKGPRPFLPARSSKPDPEEYIGNPGPYDNKYVGAWFKGGPSVRFVAPGEPRGDNK